MHHLHVETMQEQPVADMNKSVENLLISSHDVISSINSSSLGTQNSNASCSNAVLSSSPETNAHDAASGQEKSSPMSSPNLSPKPSPKNHARKEIYKSNHLDNVCKESVHLSKSDEQQAQETINKSSDSAELSKSSSHKRKKDRNRSKKKTPWYNVLYPTYKSRSEDFKRIFKDVPDDERLVVDYSCALQREILVHGRLYVSQNYACFYANIFMWETLVSLRWKDVTSMTKEKTALVIPNAILLCTETNKFFFTSFGARDKTYLMLFRVWQNALIGQPMSMSEMWQLVHTCYGDELGLTSDDEDYVPPPLPPQEDDKMSTRLSVESFSEVEGEKNYCEKGDLPEQCRIIDPSPTTSSPVDPILVEAPLKSESHIDPTDLSDTTESEADKHGLRLGIRSTPVCTSTHEGRQLANATFPMHIDQLFTLLFTNSKFFLDYHTARKTTDLVQSAWTQNDQTGQKMRTISLVVHLTQSIGPKTSQVTETQVMLPCSVPGSLYSIDVECVNAGIPYADSFSLASHYCLTRVSENETNLSVFCQIKYKKSVWSFVRSVIEKNCWVGLEEYFNSLVKALSVECEEASGTSGIKRKTRRRRRVAGAGVALPVLPSDSVNIPPVATSIPPITSSGGNARGDNGTIVSWVLLIAVLCLTVINGLLYYKLWGLEEAAAYTIMDLHVLKNTPKTDEDWINLLQQQESLHNVEMRKWQRVLHTAAQLLRQTEESLTELQMSIHPTASEKMFSVLKPGLNNLNTHTEQQRRDEM